MFDGIFGSCRTAYFTSIFRRFDSRGRRYTRRPPTSKGVSHNTISRRATFVSEPALLSLPPRNARTTQPPLQYYLRVMAAKDWDNVTFLTAAWEDRALNPTFLALEMMADTGVLGENVHVFNVRLEISNSTGHIHTHTLVSSQK